MNKPELRRALRADRKAFVAARGGNHFAPDHALLHLSPLLNSKSIISIYQPSNDECSCKFLNEFYMITFALPCANTKEDRLVFRRWSPKEPLEMSQLGFLQPLQSAAKVTPTIILTPLLGFDRALNRLGQGAGHYDRAFEDFPEAARVGIAWSVQELPSLTPDLWDVPLDAVLTEQEWITEPPETNS